MLKINSVEEHIKEIKKTKKPKEYNSQRPTGFLPLPHSIIKTIWNENWNENETSFLKNEIEKQKILDRTVVDDLIAIHKKEEPRFYKITETQYLDRPITNYELIPDESPSDKEILPHLVMNIYPNLAVVLRGSRIGIKHEHIKLRLEKIGFYPTSIGKTKVTKELTYLRGKTIAEKTGQGTKLTNYGEELVDSFLTYVESKRNILSNPYRKKIDLFQAYLKDRVFVEKRDDTFFSQTQP